MLPGGAAPPHRRLLDVPPARLPLRLTFPGSHASDGAAPHVVQQGKEATLLAAALTRAMGRLAIRAGSSSDLTAASAVLGATRRSMRPAASALMPVPAASASNE